MLVRERPPLRHALTLATPAGRSYRWATDEADPADTPGGLQHASTMPGGFEQGQCVLPRKPSVDYDDLERLSTIEIRSADGEVVGEYRLERTPRTSGDQMSVSPGMVGWQAHLADDKSATALIIDRDLNRWGPTSRAYKISLLASSYQVNDGSAVPDHTSGLPGLTLAFDGAWDTPAMPSCTLRYDAGAGLKIGAIYLYWGLGTAVGTTAPWAHRLYVANVDNNSAGTAIGDNSNLPSTGQYLTCSPNRYAHAELRYDATPSGVDGLTYQVDLRDVAVVGTHGLTSHGTGPGGFLASDVAAWIIGTFAPLLNFSTGSDGTIRPSAFAIPHLTFPDPSDGGAGDMLRQTARFELQDWAVWEKRTFYFNERGERGRNWRVRVGPAQLEETGPQIDRVWESVIVAYRDVDGSTRTVGPPGSGADTETINLKDQDPENPANQLGLTRRDVLQAGVETPASATKLGETFLALSKALDSSGRARLVGHVEDDRGRLHPYSHVRAGDTLTPMDAADPMPRRIVKADVNHSERATSVDLDAPPDGLQALLEQLGVKLVPLGFS